MFNLNLDSTNKKDLHKQTFSAQYEINDRDVDI